MIYSDKDKIQYFMLIYNIKYCILHLGVSAVDNI